MGAYAPADDGCPPLAEIAEQVVEPTLAALADAGTPFVGCLYVGLMLTADGIRVLEFNARFGDPETQAVVPLAGPGFLDLLLAAARSDLTGAAPPPTAGAAVVVVAAAQGYPAAPRIDDHIIGLGESMTTCSASTRARHAISADGWSRREDGSSASWARVRMSPPRGTAPTRTSSASTSRGCGRVRYRHPPRWSPTMSAARVGIVMGSESDLPMMRKCGETLDEYGIAWEIGVMSAHRAPDVVRAYARQAERRGLQVLVAGAGAAAHLPGVLASMTPLPVIGVPLAGTPLSGMDALLSIVQMPPGVRSRPSPSARWARATPVISPPGSSPSSTRRSPPRSPPGVTRWALGCASPRDSTSAAGDDGELTPGLPRARREASPPSPPGWPGTASVAPG